MMVKMARYDDHHRIITTSILFIAICLCTKAIYTTAASSEGNDILTACQHLRQAESRRAKALGDSGSRVQIPKCNNFGDFEKIQCSNEINGTECWCVDEYGIEIAGSRRDTEEDVNCDKKAECSASSCRMFCPSGFAQDARSGCPICQCRDPCAGVVCPGGLACQPQEVQCITEPCPPVPTCKRARSLSDLCPAGHPLTITDTDRPFLCGTDPGKPNCPPLHRCLVQPGNDYGVCCPSSLGLQKPGECPLPSKVKSTESTGVLCGTPCTHDLECPQMEKCCMSNGCGTNCQQPHNVTNCHQARMLSQILSVNEREGRGYIPECDVQSGSFTERQCSRNGLVCWCVDAQTGNKLQGSMGSASSVDCKKFRKPTARSQGRSVDSSGQKCDQNICASICEYGFKIDHNGCPTCECSEPCEGYYCPLGSHCEVAKDPECQSGSALCASEPLCKPDMVYSNPCDVGTPLVHNVTGEVMYCLMDSTKSRAYQARSFFDLDPVETGRALGNLITCPENFECTKLHGEPRNVCCLTNEDEEGEDHQQSMCEYLREFSDRMEGTEEGMTLALPTPTCNPDGSYTASMCKKVKTSVTRNEKKKILEDNNIREMKSLLRNRRQTTTEEKICPLHKCVPCEFGYKYEDGCRTCKCEDPPAEQREQRSANENLKLTQVSNEQISTMENNDEHPKELDIKSIIRHLKQNILEHPQNTEARYLAEILSRKLLNQVVQERNAKVIDVGPTANHQQLYGEDGKNKFEKPNSNSKETKPPQWRDNDLVEIEVEECWCIDGFGTEIPDSRGYNVTEDSCQELRESIDCLDITCRMGCDYGFILDPITKCPSCECRDPCDSVTCPDGEECRTVDVSCEGEYCPPVPACLPRKPGQCPYLVPPGTEGSSIDVCQYECRSDVHCDGTKRCCSNGCGTQCVEPQHLTACQHLQIIQLHQASELGIPAKQKYIAQCDFKTGSWNRTQCGPGLVCWCVDNEGNELSGTRTHNRKPDCDHPNIVCPSYKCRPCEYGYVINDIGCRTCDCRDPCSDITCPNGEECQLVKVECIDEPCPPMPICRPERESVCPEGVPLKEKGRELVCGPHNDAEVCPSTHTCQLDMNSIKGVCCGKTRDVCFESIEDSCLKENVTDGGYSWRFSSKLNKCIRFDERLQCQSKNSFHSETACASVCPVLSPCERLRLRNSLAAKRDSQPLAWFQPRCDPETGLWSPVQCLGKSPTSSPTSYSSGTSRAFSIHELNDHQSIGIGVCWCADKKGAPVKGSLTRGTEPKCNHRQARRRMQTGSETIDQDPMMEELIRQLTIVADEENFIDSDFEKILQKEYSTSSMATVTEKILNLAFIAKPSSYQESTKKLNISTTRCNALQNTASFPVACDSMGAFEPMQCNEAVCWCVDDAGNQLRDSNTFAKGTVKCVHTQIDIVSIELHLINTDEKPIKNLYDVIKGELITLLGETPDNLRVHENLDGTILLKFDLTDNNKVDTAFALEETVKHNTLYLANGQLTADITMSRFVHRNSKLPVPQSTALIPESTFQTIVFILATTSAFLVSIFVVFIMLKRGRSRTKHYNTNKGLGMGDKFLDYSSPIFVLNPSASVMKHYNENESI